MEADRQVFLGMGPEGCWKDENPCRPAGTLACAWTLTPAVLSAFQALANSFLTRDSAGDPPPPGSLPSLQAPPTPGCSLAVFALTFLHRNCLHA